MANHSIATADSVAPSGNLLTAWRVHLWVLLITLVAEAIGPVTIPLGIGKVVMLPLVWGMLLGAALSLASHRMPTAVALMPSDQQKAGLIIQVAVLLFVAKLSLVVGSSVPKLMASGWALLFQELGHFFGTALLGMPLALLLGIKREAIGATFSVGREPSLAIISEKYGLSSPEGRGVMAEYVTGTVIGAIFIAIIASLLTSLKVFDPLALAMGAGIGSGSMMAAAAGAIAAQQPANIAQDVAAFAAASNLITSTVGVYFTLFLSLPFANFMYGVLEPVLGRGRAVRSTEAAIPVDAEMGHDTRIGMGTLIGLLLIVAILTLVGGNWITYNTIPTDSLIGAGIVVLVAIIGEVLKRFLPFSVPAVFWATLIGMGLTAPYWDGASWMAAQTGKINFLALATPVLAYAGLSLAKDLPVFKALGWRIVVVSLAANAGTFLFATFIAHFFVHTPM
jgi:hypothetical protein